MVNRRILNFSYGLVAHTSLRTTSCCVFRTSTNKMAAKVIAPSRWNTWIPESTYKKEPLGIPVKIIPLSVSSFQPKI